MKKWTLRFAKENKADFDAIKQGLKIVETRAASPKYQSIQAGDVLILSCDGQKIEKEIRQVQHFESIEALFGQVPIANVNPFASSLDAAREKYYSFPGYKEKIKEFGLFAFYL